MKLSRILSIVLTLCMMFSLAACGGNNPADDAPPANPGNNVSQPNGNASGNGSPAADGEQINITFWTMWDGGDVTVARKIVDEYNENHPDVFIDFIQQEFSQYSTKFKTAIANGTGPDLAIQYVGGFIDSMKNDGLIQPVNKLAETAGIEIDYDGYTQTAINANKDGDDYYAIPTDNLIRVMMYNKSLLADTGYLGEDGSFNWGGNYNDFMATLGDIQSQLPDGVATLSLTMRPPQIVLGWLTTYAQMGGKTFIDAENKCTNMDRDLAIAALEAYQAIYANYVPEGLTPPADLEMFEAGEAAIYIDGAWNVTPAAEALGDDFGVTLFPQWFDTKALITTNHAFIIPTNSNMTQEKAAAIVEFIKWWGENNWKWGEAGHLPAYVPSTETAEFKSMPWPQYYEATLDYAVPIYTMEGANIHQLSDVQEPLQMAMLGVTSCEDAVDTVIENLNVLIPELAS